MIKSETKQKFVIINQNAGYLMIDIANSLREKYPDLTLITGRLIERNNKLHPSIKIINTIAYQRNSNIKRILTWFCASIHILFLLLTKFKKTQLLIVTNPPFAPLLTSFTKNRFSVLIYDLYPDILINSGFLSEKSFFAKKWKNVNRKVFSNAEKIYTISEGMKNQVSKYISKQNIRVIPLWTHSNFFRPIPKEANPFITKHKLTDKFIVLYSGNLGQTHDVEVIIEIAKKIDSKDIVFLIIGDGDKKNSMLEESKKGNLSNCVFLPFQDVKTLPYSLATADIAIVTTSKGASNLSVPSKTFDLMSVGVPIIGIAEKESELAQLIDKHKNGRHFSSKDVDGMKVFIESLCKEKDILNNFKENSLLGSKSYTPANAQSFTNEL